MTSNQLLRTRLRNQLLVSSRCRTPHDVVSGLCAVQAQDYGAASWALGLRAPRLTCDEVDRAFDDGAILRTHLLRPTWHFVSPSDIRWMVALSAPRLRAVAASYHRALGLGARVLATSRRTIERALGRGQPLTRSELAAALRRAGVPVDGLRPNFLLMDAEANALVCSGPRRGRQFTYVLLDERAPAARTLDRDEALSVLALRYFTGHGPATIRDFAWWAGLSALEARRGIDANGAALERMEVDGAHFWLAPARVPAATARPLVHLLPCFDEYSVAYQHRGLLTGGHSAVGGPSAAALLGYIVVIDGRAAGTWRRTATGGVLKVEVTPSRRLSKDERSEVEIAGARLGVFARLPVETLIG